MITMRQYAAGEVIFSENDAGETAYIIVRGRVEVLKMLEGKNVHLAYIGAGEPLGEMGVIDEKPRSATVVAVEETVVRELHRDDLFQNLQEHPEVAISLLKVLFERLREADATILQLYRSHPALVPFQPARLGAVPPQSTPVVSLQGLTPQASSALPETPFRITAFPFRIGRRCHDPLVHNELSIPDAAPLQISRHHLALIKHDGRIGVADRGSRLGSWLDGRQLGGEGGHPGPLFFTGTEGTLVLGNQFSPFKFHATITTSSSPGG
jgi:CRP/FNR family transcriptional regulator, cyclic AMP receptor protein